jgi:hypothetical protein
MLQFPLLRFAHCTEHASTPPARFAWANTTHEVVCVIDSFRGSVVAGGGIPGTLKVLQRSDVLVCQRTRWP